MTSASELFYNRRSRFGRNTHGSDHLGFDSSPERNFHYTSSRRNHNHHRHDSDGCDLLRRSPHPRHACNRAPHSERESVRLNESIGHTASGNTTNIETSINQPRLTGNDRLPGAVLLARERLLQRLRGISLSENRQNRASSGVNRNRPMISNSLRVIDAGDIETEPSTGLSTGTTPLAEVTSQLEHLQLSQPIKKKPPGLTQAALDCLHLEVFRTMEKGLDKASSRESCDCSICLESFVDGDKLTRLPCRHIFHSTCLDPWIRTCGDCPYCRRGIALMKRT